MKSEEIVIPENPVIKTDVVAEEQYIETNEPGIRYYCKDVRALSEDAKDSTGKQILDKDGAPITKTYNLKFFCPWVEKAEASVEKYGVEKTTWLINFALNYLTRLRIKSRVPQNKDEPSVAEAQIRQLAAENPLIFSIKDAADYIPGEKELDAAGYTVQMKNIIVQIKTLQQAMRLEKNPENQATQMVEFETLQTKLFTSQQKYMAASSKEFGTGIE